MSLSVVRRFATRNEILHLDRLYFQSSREASKWLRHTDEKGRYLKSDYAYSRSKNVPSPFLANMPLQQLPFPDWHIKAVNAHLDNIYKKGLARGLKETLPTLQAIVKLPVNLNPDRARSISDFIPTLVDEKERVITYQDFAKNQKTTVSDEAFGEYRLSGPNPTTIRPATVEDLKSVGEGEGKDKNLISLIEKKQLYIVDYSVFAALTTNKFSIKGIPKLNLGSVALLRQENHALVPVCIKVIGNHQGKPEISRSRVFYPSDPGHSWEIAKAVFQTNDSEFHMGLAHLGGTHLVSEVFLVATYRRLPDEHPVHKFLAAHFDGTAFINDSADKLLVSDYGVVDRLISSDIREVRKHVSLYTEAITANDMRFPERIKARKMDATNAPDLDYAFRDDGLLLWDAIYQWVDDYLRIFYPSDQAVAADQCLHGWIDELKAKDGGNVRWLDNFDFTNKWLTDVIASVVFISSVEHAAVNFPQLPFMQFTPAFPGALYGTSEEVFFKPNPNEQDYLNLLPPLSIAFIQSQVGHALGSVVHFPLGHYEKQASAKSQGHYFLGLRSGAGVVVPRYYLDNVESSVKRFQGQLDMVTKKIKERNEKRKERHLYPYTTLLPENIPQSINI